jgi:hypothetical protein
MDHNLLLYIILGHHFHVINESLGMNLFYKTLYSCLYMAFFNIHIPYHVSHEFYILRMECLLHLAQPDWMLKSTIFWNMTPCSPLSCTRRSSETSGTTQRTTRRHIPEDDTLHLSLFFIFVYLRIKLMFVLMYINDDDVTISIWTCCPTGCIIHTYIYYIPWIQS